jgi:hypothetical protein
MESNTSSVVGPGGLGLLTAAVEELAAEDLTRLPDGEAAQRVLTLRRRPTHGSMMVTFGQRSATRFSRSRRR